MVHTWLSRLDEGVDFLANEVVREEQRRRIHSHVHHIRRFRSHQPPEQVEGDRRLALLQSVLEDGFSFHRSADQKWFHRAFVAAILPLMYDRDWDQNQMRVMTQMQITQIHTEVMCMCPRRWGKTWALAMFVAAVSYVMPGITIAVFTTGARTGNAFKDKVRMFLRDLPDGLARVVKDSGEHLYLGPVRLRDGARPSSQEAKRYHSDPRTTKLICYPGGRSRDCKSGCIRKGGVIPQGVWWWGWVCHAVWGAVWLGEQGQWPSKMSSQCCRHTAASPSR